MTQGYLLAEAISKVADAFLLLSATPFRGKLEEIYYSISLLDPDILGPVHTFLNDPAASQAKLLQRKFNCKTLKTCLKAVCVWKIISKLVSDVSEF